MVQNNCFYPESLYFLMVGTGQFKLIQSYMALRTNCKYTHIT